MKPKFLFSLLIISLSTNAQITTDGSLGQPFNLPGPDYQINADLGQQRGSNLFHSFQDFNLQSFETATFLGPNHIQNVISRVTGGNPSNIDGLLRSTIPNADMYFLNPYGIMFGPNARLDVPGSFHASTADYLRLGQGGRFDVRNPSDTILTVAPIESFGFLTDSPAKITTQSSKLSVPSDKTLSLIGGDLHLSSQIPLTVDNSLVIPIVESKSILAAKHGQLNLASIASPGEVILNENDLTLHGKGGQITIENTLVEMSGYGGGAVFIRAGQFLLDNAIIRSNTLGNQDGKDINLKLTEAVYINGLNSEISAITVSTNNTGNISIEVPFLEVTGALINTISFLTGEVGNIEINAEQVMLKDGAFIASGSSDAGHSGDIRLNVRDSLSLNGFSPGYRIHHGIEFENAQSVIFSVSIGTGNSGNIFIDTKNLNMKFSKITTNSQGNGKSGNILINAKQANLDGSVISNATYNQGQAGDLEINLIDDLSLVGRFPYTYVALGRKWTNFPSTIRSTSIGTAPGGTIDIHANSIILDDGGKITASSFATGNAGDILIQANHLLVMNHGQISTEAQYAVGGNITLNVPHLLYLQEGMIITSVHGGHGDGGNIFLDSPQITVLNQAKIEAQADAGNGGSIRIAAEHFIKSYESLINASSRFGLDGHVEIDSPNRNITEGMLTLASEIVDASSMMEKSCEARSVEAYKNRSHFIVNPIAGSPASPFDLQPSRLSQSSTKINPTYHQQSNQNLATHHHRQPSPLMTCQPVSIEPPEIPPRELNKKVIPKQLF